MDAFKKVFTNSNVQMVITLSGVALALILVIVTNQLTPVVQDIALIKQSMAQVEKSVEQKVNYSEFNQFTDRLDRIERKIDNANFCKQ